MGGGEVSFEVVPSFVSNGEAALITACFRIHAIAQEKSVGNVDASFWDRGGCGGVCTVYGVFN